MVKAGWWFLPNAKTVSFAGVQRLGELDRALEGGALRRRSRSASLANWWSLLGPGWGQAVCSLLNLTRVGEVEGKGRRNGGELAFVFFFFFVFFEKRSAVS